ncbi:hypothetical protein BDR26DRAFT_809240 [Obelidium mucronatum]|nr:hypothetical protein BDR26DRAFT_809240 [Obelidium mucronatum]
MSTPNQEPAAALKVQQRCRFFATEKGCHSGDSCRFSHQLPPQPKAPTQSQKQKPKKAPKSVAAPVAPATSAPPVPAAAPAPTAPRVSVPTPNPARAPMTRPSPKVPENLTPLELELRSIERRYRASYKIPQQQQPQPSSLQQQHSLPPTIIEFDMVPSDPDFPFDLEVLKLRMVIPTHVFQPDAVPTLASILPGTRIKVLNTEIPPDLARAVEIGFRKRLDAHLLSNKGPGTTLPALIPGQVLLSLTNWLDRELEKLLSGLGDSDVVGVTALVVNNARTPEEMRQSITERVNAGFNQVDLMVARTVPVDENDEAGGSSDSDDDLTGSEFNETESVVSSKINAGGEVLIDNDTDDNDENDATTEDKEGGPSSVSALNPAHTGTQIRLVDPSLKGIAILECISPKFLLSCTRCKSNFDSPQNLTPNTINTRACPTCSTPVSITYRPSMVHMSSQTVGYLDLDGYALLDMLPSAWKVTCENCSKEISATGVLKSLPRGEVEFRIGCTGCHSRMGIMINDIKYIKLMPSATVNAGPRMMLKPKKKKPLNEGIILGEALPKNGACSHYRKSYRWFRFPCCGRAFACDICHEENKSDDHEMKWANRMICGFCSREQVYSQQASCLCGKELTRRSGGGGGYWEGGNGTRSKVLMSKKDPRKHKGVGKTTSMKSSRVGKKV